MKKSTKIRVISLIVAAALLLGALSVTAYSGSPYETLKNALLDLSTLQNVTVKSEASYTVDGVVQDVSKEHAIYSENGSLNYWFDDAGSQTDGFRYDADGLTINYAQQGDDGRWWYGGHYNPYAADSYRYRYRSGLFGLMSVFPGDEGDSAEMRFLELLADTLVGDLKNHVAMSTSGDIRHLSGTLTDSQIPELYKAGLDLMLAQQGDYYGGDRSLGFTDANTYRYETWQVADMVTYTATYEQKVRLPNAKEQALIDIGEWENLKQDGQYQFLTDIDGREYIVEDEQQISDSSRPVTREDFDGVREDPPFNIPVKSVIMDYVHGEADVDAEGRLLNINANATVTVINIFDETCTVEVLLNATLSDYGVSSPACPIPGAAELLTAEDYLQNRFGTNPEEIPAFYFTVNADGSINPDSLTTAYPLIDEKYAAEYSAAHTQPSQIRVLPFPDEPQAVTVEEAAALADGGDSAGMDGSDADSAGAAAPDGDGAPAPAGDEGTPTADGGGDALN